MGRPKFDRYVSQVKKEFKYRKTICPFISSTFQDFQAEREILVKNVFPTIDQLCKERGTNCIPVDLRWGINDSQVNSGLVLQLCLDYVQKCSPFFICLLGERYGSHRPVGGAPLPESFEELEPDAHWLDKNFMVAYSGGYKWIAQELYQQCSITELEIIQACFLEENPAHCYFYFRKPDHVDLLYTDLPSEERRERLALFEAEDPYSRFRQEELKNRIVTKGLPVQYFQTPEDLAHLVLEDWKRVIDLVYPPLENIVSVGPEFERFSEWMSQETFAETRRRVFVRSTEINDTFDRMSLFAQACMDDPPPDMRRLSFEEPKDAVSSSISLYRQQKPMKPAYKSILALVGDRGCGKTSVLANWVKEFSDEHKSQGIIQIFSHYVGSSARSSDILCLMRRCVQELRSLEDQKGVVVEGCSDVSSATDDRGDYHHVCEAFQAALAMGPCVLVIDGIDELGAPYGLSAQQVKEMSWLPQPLPPQCKLIVTTAKSDRSFCHLSRRIDTEFLTVPLIKDSKAKTEVISKYLAQHCKCLNEDQIERVVTSRLSDLPLFLSVLANELSVFGVYSRLDYHLDTYVEAASIRDLWGQIVQRWIKDYSNNNNNNSIIGESEVDTLGGLSPSNDADLTGWVADALRLIAVARHGLTESEILAVLKELGYTGDQAVTSCDWAIFRSATMESLFERPGGLVTFFHQHFREAVEFTLLGAVTPTNIENSPSIFQYGSSPNSYQSTMGYFDHAHQTTGDRRAVHCILARYFMKCPHGPRRTEELPWHLERASDYPMLSQVLSEPRMFIDMVSEKRTTWKLDMIHYWRILRLMGYDPASTYQFMLNKTACTPDEETASEITPDVEVALLCQQVPAILRTSASDLTSNASSQDYTDFKDCAIQEIQSDLELNRYEGSLLHKLAGQFLSELGYFSQAEVMLLDAHDQLKKQSPLSEDQECLLCEIQESIANLYHFQLRKKDAKKWYKLSLETAEGLDPTVDREDMLTYHERKGRLHDQLGHMATYDKDFDKAERMLRQAYIEMNTAGSVPGKATVEYHQAVLRMRKGSFDEAEKLFREVLRSRERWYGRSHYYVAEVLNDLAGMMSNPSNKNVYKGYNVQQAEKLFRRALKIREHNLGGDHLLVATSLFHLSQVIRHKGTQVDRDEAIKMLQRALDIRCMKLGSKHQLTIRISRALADLEKQAARQSKPKDNRKSHRKDSTLPWQDSPVNGLEQRKPKPRRTSESRRALRNSREQFWSEDVFPTQEANQQMNGYHSICDYGENATTDLNDDDLEINIKVKSADETDYINSEFLTENFDSCMFDPRVFNGIEETQTPQPVESAADDFSRLQTHSTEIDGDNDEDQRIDS